MDLRILEIASHTDNNKIIENYTHKSKNKNPLCGDEMEISLIVKNDIVKDMGYQCKSCVYCQASVSLLSRKIKGKKIGEIKMLVSNGEKLFDNIKINIEKHWKDFKEIFNKKNLSRKECLLLPIKTIAKALNL
ncbi:iron-sulfur cluster assembly scaffold protein [Candidatus Pelagibacter sp.]|nr:iron-sulfur cluster assembly scaffold protein [Candidatus Pelagibacter sp.]